MRILGISALYHDSAAALVRDGAIIAAAQEERFSRKRHDAGFPVNAIRFVLEFDRCSLDSVDYVVFYDKPFLKFDRLLETYLSFAPKGFQSFRAAMPVWAGEKLFLKKVLLDLLRSFEPSFDRDRLLFSGHHLSHAASAFYPSPFEQAVILTMDGVGEWATGSLAIGCQKDLEIFKELHFPHSLGLLYSAFTYYAGFKVNSGEHKLMGLAPYGEPRFVRTIYDHLIDVKDDGSFRLNLDYFDYCTGLRMTNGRFHALFGREPRNPESALEQFHMDIAASVQAVTEEIMIKLVRSAVSETGLRKLCLAGGVALNCVANGKLLKNAGLEDIWVQPAAGDAGGALGAALVVYHLGLDRDRQIRSGDGMNGAYLGPEFPQSEVERRLQSVGAIFKTLPEIELLTCCARDLAAGRSLGWFQGRMEFGPRALGARSILGDPRSAIMQKILNLKIKFRESFRPFAPAVLRDDVNEWFDFDKESPYMLLVAHILEQKRCRMTEEENALFGVDKLGVPRSAIPAVTHVDYSARIQTVDGKCNRLFFQLLVDFKRITGIGVLVNTSFNVRGEPIVCSPEDAFRCFMGTDLDVLAIGSSYLVKSQQKSELRKRYEAEIELD